MKTKPLQEYLENYLLKNPLNLNMHTDPTEAGLNVVNLTKSEGKVSEILCHF
jgi:hypothetical protein